jgi:hypothetical protein
MTDSMVDRVATAIKLRSFTAGQSGALRSAPLSDRACDDLARAAIDVMDEPTSEMLSAAHHIMGTEAAFEVWTAMIAAALSGETA